MSNWEGNPDFYAERAAADRINGRCNPAPGHNSGPCGPTPCTGECRAYEQPVCHACHAFGRIVEADYVSVDLDNLCEYCAYELQVDVLYVF